MERRDGTGAHRRSRAVRRGDPAAAESKGGLHGLQRDAGNRALSALLTRGDDRDRPSNEAVQPAAPGLAVQRDIIGAVGNLIGDITDTRTDEERLDALEDLQDWRDSGSETLEDFRPSSGSGFFDATLDPAALSLTVKLKVGYDFVDGNPSTVSPGFRPEEFVWTDYERTEWMARFSRDISAQWSQHFTFASTKPHWDTAVVQCSIEVVTDSEDPHYQLTVEKYPDDATMATSSVCPAGTHHAHVGNICPANEADWFWESPAEWGTGRFDSNDLREEMKLTDQARTVAFAPESAELDGAATSAVVDIGQLMLATPDMKVKLTGRANSSEAPMSTAAGVTNPDLATEKMDLARRRSEAVQSLLLDGGIESERILVRNAGMDGAAPEPAWDRVDATISIRETQLPGLHEAGHMLGLGDEYPTTANPAGTAVTSGYQAMLDAHGGPTLLRARNESAMSSGSTVQPWHYTPFIEALKQISNMTEWSIR